MWLNGKARTHEINGVAVESVGFRISRNSDIVENINTFRIVLEKDIKSPLGYKIKTAYPKKI